MSTFDYLYGRDGDEHLDVDPDDTLERIWDLSGPDPLPAGHEVEVHQWKARSAEEFMPSADWLLDHYRDIVYEQVGEDCVDSIKWDDGPLRGAAAHFVAEMNRHIHWKQAGKKVATLRYRLTDSDAGEWESVDSAETADV